MKKVLMTLVILAFCATGISASEPYTVYFFTDGDDPTVESCDILDAAQYNSYVIRLWVQSDPATGLKGFELGVDWDGAPDMITADKNPGIPSIIGDLTTNEFAGAFQECQAGDWVWITKYSVFYFGVPHMVYAIPNWTTGNMIVTSCETDFPQYPLVEGNQFGFGLPCVQDSEEESWGAVKSMYR